MSEGLSPATSSAVLGPTGAAGWVYGQSVKEPHSRFATEHHRPHHLPEPRFSHTENLTDTGPEATKGSRSVVTEASSVHEQSEGGRGSGADVIESKAHVMKSRLESPWAFTLDLAAGGAVACVAHTIVAPIERIKLVLQTQDSNAAILSGRHRHYRGFFDALGTIVKEEGFWSLWRGNLTSVIRYIPSMSLNFAFKDYYRILFAPSYAHGPPSPYRLAASNLAAGAAAGATGLFFTYPLDIAHTRLATDIGARKQFTGPLHFLRSIYRKQGLGGLYQGFPASVHGIVVHRSIYFGGFDSAKQLLLSSPKTDNALGGSHGELGHHRSLQGSFWMRWLLAQGATTSASLLSYPFDTVRHRMMMQSGVDKPEYSSTLDCWRKILRKEGVRGFYKGLMSNILRGTGAAFVLVMYDELQGHIHNALHISK